MNRIIRLLYFVLFAFVLNSCAKEKNKEEVLRVYSEIFPEFISSNQIIRAYFEEPPPPSEYDFKDSLSKIDKLAERIELIEWRLSQLQKRLDNPREYDILNKLLPINPEKFKKTELSIYRNGYDTNFIDSSIVKPFENLKEEKIDKKDIENFKQNIVLINQIPDYDSTLNYSQSEHFVDFCYIQLSWIAFNKEKNKGIFYYGITNKERISSNFDYQYIVKINNRWRLKNE